MRERHSQVAAFYLAVMAAWGGIACCGRATAAPPNIVVILADDLGFSDLGCYGGEIDTPHLDQLAIGGLRFTQAYNTARCWPTRAALLTGYCAQAVNRDALPGGKGGTGGRRPAWARLLPELLVPAGYRTYHSGKWHIDGDPRQQGFIRSLQVEGGQNDYFDPEGVTVDGTPMEAGADFYVTTAIGGHAVECLQDHAAAHAGVPFFSYIAFTSPHFPLHAPQDVVEKYKDRYRAGWDAVRTARAERLNAAGIVTTARAPLEPQVGPPHQPKPDVLARFGPGEIDRPVPWAELTAEQREFQATKMAIHAAMVELMDRAVGRIVEQLEAMDALDDTLILFLSDNGASAEILIRGKGHDPAVALGSAGTFPCLGPGWSSCANTPFRRHKTWVHEGGIATPWIVHWPKGIALKRGLRTQPVHVIDVVPTVLELAGLAPPREHAGTAVPALQGRSFAACLTDPAAPPAHETLWWCHEGNRAVRVGDWKLVAAKGDPWELYDLAADRCETANLADREPARVTQLEQAWERIAADCRRLAGPESTVGGAAPARRPNIVYVMTDDQGYGDIAAHGNPVLATPNLDRMRRESVRFTEFHASPTCAPTRAALLTGRHEFRSGVTHTIFERERLALSAVTLPQLLRRGGGYATGVFGKWHLGDEDEYQPGKRGFDRVFIHGGGGIGQSYPGSCGDAPDNSYRNPFIRSDGTFVQTRGYCTDVFFDAALDWIDGQRKADTPFFCYLATNTPHDPLDCPPGSDTPWLARLEAAGITDPKQRERIAKFYGMIANVDANMGRLFTKLDEWGLAEDTLVVFTTDNGTANGAAVFNDGMRGQKVSPYRGGTRVPSFWRWPGRLPAGVDVPAVTAHIDVLPTLCELAGVALPPAVAGKVEGRSLVPLLTDASAAWPDRPLITHVGRWERGEAAQSAYRNCRIREGRWSLVNTKNRPDAWELYDIASDAAEKHDLAAAQPDVVKRLAATYDAWWQSVQPDLVNENIDGPAENPFATAYWKQFGPRPTLTNVRYGDHPKQKLHFWKSPHAEPGKPTPLLFFIHGGGWQGGNRMSGLTPILAPVLEAGISVTSIEYRFIHEAMQQGIEPPVKAPLADAARALQTVRSKAAEWGIDKERIVAAGGSAGACSSLWLAFHDDMADPTSVDPVARESTRLLAAAVSGAQTTLDPAQMKAWTPNSRYGGHAFGFMTSPDQRDSQFAQFLAAREKILPWIEAYSPYALVTPDDPPVALFYATPPALGRDEKDPTHTANFGVKLEERLDAAGVPCELVYPGAVGVRHATLQDAIIGFLKPAAESSQREPARRPNIVFFLCDDLGSGDLACTGSRDIQTPAIDALFARGTRLSRHWAGNAVCAPSRCVLLTGKHPGHAAIRSNREVQPEGQVPMPAGTVTLAKLLGDAGYATGGFGKWGLGAPGSDSDPIACGFDSFFGYNCQRQAHTYYPGHLWDGRSRVPLDGTQYAADLIAERQLAFIKANAGRPFFLYVPTTVPHLALQVPADEPSLADYERHFNAEAPYLGGKGYVPCQRPLATYAAMITRMDREVGRIVKELDDLGLTDDTIFVFSSDNGATWPGLGGIDTARLASNGALRDWKGSPYEGGLRVPTVAVWPGQIPAGRVVDAPTGFEDWLPTLLDLAGLADRIPAGIDGVSLAAALAGKGALPRERVLYRELTERQWQTALDAHGRWKVVRKAVGRPRSGQAAPTELYDLAADPGETTDVAAGHPDVVARMEAILDREHVPHPDWPLAFADRLAPPDAAAARARRPNILYIIVDDQSPFDLPCYNPASTLHAPVIDRLAREGMVLDAAYHMGSFSGAVCTPSRHMVMCGRSVWHLPIGPRTTGHEQGGKAARAHCPPDIVRFTLAPVFNRAGYDTMRTCKQGNAYEAADALFTIRHDATKREGTHAGGSAWHADRVLDYLAERERTHDTDPFLIYFGFSHPHDTRDGTPELLTRYGATNHADPATLPPADPRQPPLPPNYLPRHPFDHGHMDVRDEVAVSGVWKNRDERTIRNELGREYACGENIDRQIGRVLEKLAALGELDNTWIFYTADHGMAIGRHGLQGKQNLYEHTWRVPFIVRGPGVKPGSRAPGNVYLGDTLATLCDICGIAPPAANEGTSFLPVLAGTRQTVRDVLYGVYCGGQKPGIRCVRKGAWKLVKYESPSGGLHTQLFNLHENPHELLGEHHDPAVTDLSRAAPTTGQKNLADDPAFAATRAEMEALLLTEMRRHDDPFRFSDQSPP